MNFKHFTIHRNFRNTWTYRKALHEKIFHILYGKFGALCNDIQWNGTIF